MSRILIPTTTLICFILASYFHQKIVFPAAVIDPQKVAINVKSEMLKVTSFGLTRVVSDVLWIKTLLDSDLEHYSQRDLRSWMYLRFNTIAELDPKFYENYNFGGQYLMIVKDDLSGAEELILKGLKYYPLDLYLNFHTGYLYAIEMGETLKAIPYFERIKDHPERPIFVDSIYLKLVNMSFGPKEALPIIEDAYQRQTEEGPVKERLKQQLYTVRAMVDLSCLNEGRRSDCRRYDLNGAPYKKGADLIWRSAEPLLKMKLSDPKKK